MSAPRPRSSIRELTNECSPVPGSETHVLIEISEDARGELSDGASGEDEPVDDVRDEELLYPSVSAAGVELNAGFDSSPTEVDLPDFRRRQPGRKTIAALAMSAALVSVTGVVWNQHVNPAEHVTASVAPSVPDRRVPERAPEPRGSELAAAPVSPPATTTSEAASASPSALDGAQGTPRANAVAPAVVTVKPVPRRWSAAKRAPKLHVEPTPTGDSPFEDASKDSHATTTPAPTTESPPEGTPRAAAAPEGTPAPAPEVSPRTAPEPAAAPSE
jgi:hypothetical protein